MRTKYEFVSEIWMFVNNSLTKCENQSRISLNSFHLWPSFDFANDSKFSTKMFKAKDFMSKKFFAEIFFAKILSEYMNIQSSQSQKLTNILFTHITNLLKHFMANVTLSSYFLVKLTKTTIKIKFLNALSVYLLALNICRSYLRKLTTI